MSTFCQKNNNYLVYFIDHIIGPGCQCMLFLAWFYCEDLWDGYWLMNIDLENSWNSKQYYCLFFHRTISDSYWSYCWPNQCTSWIIRHHLLSIYPRNNDIENYFAGMEQWCWLSGLCHVIFLQKMHQCIICAPITSIWSINYLCFSSESVPAMWICSWFRCILFDNNSSHKYIWDIFPSNHCCTHLFYPYHIFW